MDAVRWARVSQQLDALLDLDLPGRESELVALAAHDPTLAQELRRLLALGAAREDFLAEPLRPSGRDDDGDGKAPRAGERVGAYTLLRVLGEGGMGQVWLAARADGLYQREVALKLLRAEAAAHGLRARFGRERRILAQLSHPNIARLFDAGVDAEGRPYLALEYVEGETLIDATQRRALDLRARLALFLQVCDAVAYAHAHLVVHRDLKPSNILVTREGTVRLLDFGIAKLLDPEAATGETELTRLGGRAYTLHYAAPEQIRGEAISTQTDVYALGVVLYELLTGRRPYRLKRGSAAEVEEAILALEPRRPSQALRRREDHTGDTGGDLQARADVRLARALGGDLDTIVLKALQKRPEQRYASVEAFAKDVQRHLAGRPISARADSLLYRSYKFLRRNAWGVSLAAGVLALLLFAAAALFWQGQRALAEAQRAQAMQDFMLGLFERTDPNVAQRGDLSVAELLRDGARRAQGELQAQPAVQRELVLTIASLQSGFGRYEDALGLLDGLAAPDEALARLRLGTERGRALRGLDRYRACLDALRPLQAEADALRVAEPLAVAHYHAMRGRCHRMSGEVESARADFELALHLREARAPALLVAENLTDLAALDADAGRHAQAAAKMRDALARLGRAQGENNIMGLNLWRSLGAIEREQGNPDAAEHAFRRAIELGDRLFPEGHPSLAEARRQLAATYVDYGRLDEAEPLLREVLAFQRRSLGATHPDVGSTLNSQAILAWKRGELERAVALLREAVALWRNTEQPGRLASGLHNLGMVLADAGRPDEAEPLLLEALALREAVFGPQREPVAVTLRLLGELDIHAHRFDPAAIKLERALAIELAHHGEQHPQTAQVRISLARLDYARGNAAAGDARVQAVVAGLAGENSERRRVRAEAQLVQIAARCRIGARQRGRVALEALAAEAATMHDAGLQTGLRPLLTEARTACDGAR
jgi:serine/threonine protein kinase/Tfp pilus assembly protein PilF